jgi:GH43 family beta-xylosidase
MMLKKIFQTMVIYFDLKMTSQNIWSPDVHRMESGHYLFFIRGYTQIAATQRLDSIGQMSTILCEYNSYTSSRSIQFHQKCFVEVKCN